MNENYKETKNESRNNNAGRKMETFTRRANVKNAPDPREINKKKENNNV